MERGCRHRQPAYSPGDGGDGEGARYLHLTIEIPNERRGCELSAEEMQGYALRFNEVKVTSGEDISLAGLKTSLERQIEVKTLKK